MNNTDVLVYEITVTRLTQSAIAEICAMAMIRDGVNSIDWKIVNTAIKERWSASGMERVLTKAWKIIEDAQRVQLGAANP